ncbi:MAG: hypothetical protein WCT52_03065 [Candidatus Micrarchaeia archaeon]
MDKRKIGGYVMAIVGFAMIAAAALNYLLHWEMQMAAFAAIGLVFTTIDMKMVRKK